MRLLLSSKKEVGVNLLSKRISAATMFEDGGEGFLEKNSTGVMAKYCQRCNQHLELHGFRRGVGAKGGSIRSCPEAALADVQRRATAVAPDEGHDATPTQQRSPDPRSYVHTPAPSTTAPYGSDHTAMHDDAYVRVRKVGDLTPANHLGGTACTVVEDAFANDFIPVHITTRAPQDHLHGAAAHSDFNELEAWKTPGTKTHKSQLSSMVGGGLVPRD